MIKWSTKKKFYQSIGMPAWWISQKRVEYKGNEMTTELKPCPFCGGQAKIIEHEGLVDNITDGYQVQCMTCFSSNSGASCKAGFSKDKARYEAVKLWNNRANPAMEV